MKKNKNLTRFLLTGVLVTGIFTSCSKDYFDVNTNPNAPVDAGITELLPSAEAALGQAVGNNLAIFGGIYSQYWTQNTASSQYKTIDQYSPSADDFDRPWKIIYADGLTDLKTIVNKATAENKPQYIAIAKILQAYSFQVLTDNFGDIPFSQSLQAETGILSPTYDTQQDVYKGIFQLLRDAKALIDHDIVLDDGASDLIFAGDMSLWEKFANTLMLRASMRLSEIDPGTAQANIAALEAEAAPFFDVGEEAKIIYLNAGGNSNPLYSSMVDLSNIQNLIASSTAVDFLVNNNDDRVQAFYSPASTGAYVGIPQGDYTLPASTPVSLPSATLGADANDDASASAPVKFMTGYESLFLQAEAVARGWMTGDAQALYEAGITESFTAYDFPDTLATAYFTQPAIAYPAASPLADQIKAIITQKWIAMCGNQTIEGWAEWRRTNYPDFFTVSVNSIIGGNRFPARLFYPSTEVTTNSNFPGQKLITDKVWWDAN